MYVCVYVCFEQALTGFNACAALPPLSPENDKPMKGLRQEDMVNQDLITELRTEFSMTHDDFYMVLTDTDMKVKVRTQNSF